MCGRFTSTAPADILAEEFGLDAVASSYAPSFNIAPTHMVPVVTNWTRRSLELFQWGLIPSWSKDRGSPGQLINARSETVATRAAFKEAFAKRRCLVLADGFYEWKNQVGTKVPMYIRLASRRPFAFAGLWEGWLSPDGEVVRTCTILTTRPCDAVASIHDRMPVLLTADGREQWLDHDRADREALRALMRPTAEPLEAYSVGTLVNSPANDSDQCIAPEEPRGTLPLFPDWC